MLNAKNGRLALPSGEMDYIRFGRGPQALVMIPGVGDGLKTVKGMALPFAWMYRSLARDFTVYVFSRRVTLALGTTTRDMAGDLDFLVNTVPAAVISREVLERLRPDAVLLELSSEESFDKALAEELGLRAVYAPGLPGRSAPCAAACLMRDTIYAVIREREENNGQ